MSGTDASAVGGLDVDEVAFVYIIGHRYERSGEYPRVETVERLFFSAAQPQSCDNVVHICHFKNSRYISLPLA